MKLHKVLISKKSASRLMLITAAILLIPLVAMQFTNEVSWQIGDFILAAILLFSFGYLYVILTKNINSPINKALIGIVILVLLAIVWAVIAVDLI